MTRSPNDSVIVDGTALVNTPTRVSLLVTVVAVVSMIAWRPPVCPLTDEDVDVPVK